MLLPTLLALAASATAAVHSSHPHSHLHHRDHDASLAKPKKFGAEGFYKQQCLTHHNIHRQNHSALALTWSDALASTAQKIASTCKFEHDVEMDGGGYGQNIASGIGQENVSAVITELWYNNEIGEFGEQYGVGSPSEEKFELWGHFSQVVWKGSREVGCWTEHCPNGVELAEDTFDYTVCNYGGPGNVEGEYAENVGAPVGMTTESWSYTQ